MVAALLLLVGVGPASRASAQRAALREPQAGGLTAAEVTRLFDAYAMVQAQEFLGLDDKQYPLFVQRFRELQDTRRRHLQQRVRLLQQFRQLTQAGTAGADDAALRRSLEEWKTLEVNERDDTGRALGGVDGVLSLRQQVRFRVFEEQMERRKLELMGRARQGARAGRGVPPGDR
jgi:hypothetical protein